MLLFAPGQRNLTNSSFPLFLVLANVCTPYVCTNYITKQKSNPPEVGRSTRSAEQW